MQSNDKLWKIKLSSHPTKSEKKSHSGLLLNFKQHKIVFFVWLAIIWIIMDNYFEDANIFPDIFDDLQFGKQALFLN